jgi:hypothetical protein
MDQDVSCASADGAHTNLEGRRMTETHGSVITDVGDPAEGVDDTTAAVEGTATSTAEETAGAVGAFVGVLSAGLMIAVAAGFVVGVAVGAVIGRRATASPPRWQVWR